MNIINVGYAWKNQLEKRTETKYIILHHAAASKASVEDIHRWHLENGWSGIGYHFYIRKDGNVYQGRPIDAIGAHTRVLDNTSWNSISLGVCFEGNFNIENPTKEQIKSGIELIRYLKSIYKGATVIRHKDANRDTDCPGNNFKNEIIYEGMKEDRIMTREEALEIIKKVGIINSPEYWDKSADVVNHFDAFLINVANYIEKKENN